MMSARRDFVNGVRNTLAWRTPVLQARENHAHRTHTQHSAQQILALPFPDGDLPNHNQARVRPRAPNSRLLQRLAAGAGPELAGGGRAAPRPRGLGSPPAQPCALRRTSAAQASPSRQGGPAAPGLLAGRTVFPAWPSQGQVPGAAPAGRRFRTPARTPFSPPPRPPPPVSQSRPALAPLPARPPSALARSRPFSAPRAVTPHSPRPLARTGRAFPSPRLTLGLELREHPTPPEPQSEALSNQQPARPGDVVKEHGETA